MSHKPYDFYKNKIFFYIWGLLYIDNCRPTVYIHKCKEAKLKYKMSGLVFFHHICFSLKKSKLWFKRNKSNQSWHICVSIRINCSLSAYCYTVALVHIVYEHVSRRIRLDVQSSTYTSLYTLVNLHIVYYFWMLLSHHKCK